MEDRPNMAPWMREALARPRRKTPRRHPCEVTSDRLVDHLEKYPEAFDGEMRDAIGRLRYVLGGVARG